MYLTPKQRVMTEDNYYLNAIQKIDLSVIDLVLHHIEDEKQRKPDMDFSIFKDISDVLLLTSP